MDLVESIRRRIAALALESPPGSAPEPGEPFWTVARAEGLNLMVADALVRGGAAPLSEAGRTELRDWLRDAAAIEALRRPELRRVLDGLADAGVPSLLIKGAALAYTHYARPHQRPRRDADILIAPGDVSRARAAFDSLGYHPAVESTGDLMTSQFHVEPAASDSGLHAVDVHWRVANPRVFAEAITFEALADASVAVPELGAHAFAPSPPAQLLIAAVHRVAHHGDADTLLWLWDIHLLATDLTPQETDRLVELAAATRMCAVCRRGIGLAAEWFGTETAPTLIARLAEASAGLHEPSAQFVGGDLRLVDVLGSDLRQLSWRDGATLLREHLLPPVDFMRVRYERWPLMLLPLAYVHRVLRGAPKWIQR